MSDGRLRDVLADGEALRFEAPTRKEGRIGLTDRRVLLARDDEVVGVDLGDVDEVQVQPFDWFLALMSLALVVVGLFSARSNVVIGAVFVVAAVVNLVLTYRKRGQIKVVVEDRPRPLVVYLEETESFEDAFERRVAAYESRYIEPVDGEAGVEGEGDDGPEDSGDDEDDSTDADGDAADDPADPDEPTAAGEE